jgi:DNA-binding PadR family transcriptional regulator
MQRPTPPGATLTSTSYLVLGLLAREGPSTPYDLKRHVAATIGHFWAFPHAVLYQEPARLVLLGLAVEKRELEGRRRRFFSNTDGGREALRAWLRRPFVRPPELRDLGLLQLFFADLEPPGVALTIAEAQLAYHRAQLARYEAGQLGGDPSDGAGADGRSIAKWHGVTLRVGLLMERAAVEFWSGIVGGALTTDGATPAHVEDRDAGVSSDARERPAARR